MCIRDRLSTTAALFANMDRTEGDYMSGNVITDNQWMAAGASSGSFPALPTSTSPNVISFWHQLRGSAALGGTGNLFSNNEFVLPAAGSAPVVVVRGSSQLATMTVQDWIKLTPADKLSATAPRFTTYQYTLSPNLVPNGDFSAGLDGWTAYTAPSVTAGSLSLATAPTCVTRCALMTAGSNMDNLSSPSFTMTAGAMYQLTATARFQTAGTMYRPSVRKPVTPYAGLMSNVVSNSALSGLAGSVLPYQALFLAAGGDEGRVSLGLVAGTSVAFSDIAVRQVTGYSLAALKDWVAYAGADLLGAKTITCAHLGWPSGCTVADLSGKPVAMPTTLQANTGAVFLRTDSPWRAP